MNSRLSQPKTFGEILDQTFRICKQKFGTFFLILLGLVGPVYLLDALIQLWAGKGFIRDLSGEGSWLDQMANSFDVNAQANTTLGQDAASSLTSLILLFVYPVAYGAILFGVHQLKSNDELSAMDLVKKTFGRFFPIIGSTLLFYVIAFGMFVAAILIIVFSTISFFVGDFLIGMIFIIAFSIAILLVISYFLTRWSFFFGSSLLDKSSPGLGRSWHLTRGQSFKMMGLYFIFFLITTAISLAIEATFSMFLGFSVLLVLIIGLTKLFTTLIFAVGYSVMYLDLKVRHDADDLKEMIDDYHTN
ncbi:hypothetical protein FIU87_10610 [Bacillus sp. THAF10]|uniref:hypothetical protein n=1 Tax=Bacillus sp. THAF10 TaxID=2587848 RepID=UPI001267E693|nr:hypothetical protein [Bacillus sp. THAF10]QFT89098.1 hypothetical protein FIU87_10610 [Bacillus sp. THAF10]